MSIETDFHALLSGNAGVISLVGSRIAQSAVPAGDGFPLVVFTTLHDYQLGLSGVALGDVCAINVQCWAETAVQAEAVAAAVIAAVATRRDVAIVTSRAPVFDEETGLDAVALSITWIP